MSWAAEEFKNIDLGDRRLHMRAMLLEERMAANPMARIPQACGGWAVTQPAQPGASRRGHAEFKANKGEQRV